MKITKDTNLGELAKNYPQVAEFLQKEYGLHCLSCFVRVFDTIEIGLRLHGYGSKEVAKAVKEANRLISHETHV